MTETPSTTRRSLWTLAELTRQVRDALSVDYAGQANRQVSDVPNPRAVRYYTTLGLIDRAAEMRGRTAYYARRHLLQIVAIKRLQAEGLSLAAIQQRLTGLTDRALEKLANVPAPLARSAVKPPTPECRQPASRPEAFWGARPESENAEGDRPRDEPEDVPIRTLHEIHLADGVSLRLERAPDLEAMNDLRAAAAPLLRFLNDRRLAGPSSRKRKKGGSA